MKRGRTYSEEQNCDSHQFCIHQHYQKCKTARERQISYSLFPKQNLNTSVNLHPKCINLKNLNFETLAYENFVQGKEPNTESQRNFVKNYYLQNVPQKLCMTNQIVKECEEDNFPFNAYVYFVKIQNLAEGATKDYYAFQYKRKQYLLAAQKRAKINSNAFVKELKEQNSKSLDERSKWIQKITATLQRLGQKMFKLANTNKENESDNGKQRIFLNQKSYVNQQYLKEYKIKDPETSKQIFEELRANMLRKKKAFEDERIKYRSNFFYIEANELTVSQISEEGSQSSMTSQSMISAVSQTDKAHEDERIINELCNFEQLKKKWKTLDVERIKDLILSTLTKKIINSCEGEKAKQISTYKQQCRSVPSKLKGNLSKMKENKKRPSSTDKKSQQTMVFQLVEKSSLSKEELHTKEDLLKSDQFESMGSKYEKTRNNLFKKKEQDIQLQFSFMLSDTIKKREENTFFAQTEQSTKEKEKKMTGYRTARTNYLRV